LSAKDLDFSGKTAVITGAAGHLGVAIARSLAQRGCSLNLVDIDAKALFELVDELNSTTSAKALPFACDFADRESRLEVIREISGSTNALDLLINNAAFVGTSKLEGWSVPFESQSTFIWQRVLEVNLTSMFDFAQGLADNLKRAKSPSVINIASSHAHVGPDWSLYAGTEMSSPAAYAASKAGVVNLSKWLATTMAPQVRVNSVSPGGISRGQDNLFVQRYISRIPLNRMATESDVIGTVLFLGAELSSFITGQDICVDGGYGVW
jgi:NAD(P)-dependent dehydrogenase (short-subunit alcohol dehydrogenase family)